MTTPSKDEVLRIAGEPVRWLVDNGEDALCFEIEAQAEHYASQWGLEVQPLRTEANLLAMYAAGAEEMRERADDTLKLSSADLLLMAGEMSAQELRTVHVVLNALGKKVRALPISDSPNTFTPANKGDSSPNLEGEQE